MNNKTKTIISSDSAKNINILNINTKKIYTFPTGHISYIISTMSVNNNGTSIVTGSYDKTIKIWKKQHEKDSTFVEKWNQKFNGYVRNIIINGENIIVSADYSITIWNIDTATLQSELDKQICIIYSMSVTTDGKRLITGLYDGQIIVWDL